MCGSHHPSPATQGKKVLHKWSSGVVQDMQKNCIEIFCCLAKLPKGNQVFLTNTSTLESIRWLLAHVGQELQMWE